MAIRKGDENDPKGLIYEAYRIEGITKPECRTIFLDWALSIDVGRDVRTVLENVLAQYGPQHPDHPMTEVLAEGLVETDRPTRRGGRAARVTERPN